MTKIFICYWSIILFKFVTLLASDKCISAWDSDICFVRIDNYFYVLKLSE